jgi:ankyrin repeat protein
MASDKNITIDEQNELNERLLRTVDQPEENIYEVLKLLDKHADINYKGNKRMSSLWLAITRGHEKIVTLLLKRGAICMSYEHGYTAPQWAISNNKPRLIPLFEQYYQEDFTGRDVDVNRAFILATWTCDQEMIRTVLEHFPTIDKDSVDCNGFTAGTKAAKEKNTKKVKFLIEDINIDINVPDKNGKTIIQYAIQTDNLDLIKFLRDNQAVCTDDDIKHINALFNKDKKPSNPFLNKAKYTSLCHICFAHSHISDVSTSCGCHYHEECLVGYFKKSMNPPHEDSCYRCPYCRKPLVRINPLVDHVDHDVFSLLK